jgi:HK97 family phage major capsid protein
MNKEMRTLLTKIQEKTTQAKYFMAEETKDIEKATALMDEVDALQKEYDTAKRLYEMEKATGAESATAPVEPTEQKKAPEVDALTKFGQDAKKGFKLDKSMNEGTGADGGYAVPEDIVTRIEQYRESKASLLHLVSVVPVTTNKGQRTFKKRAQQTGFVKVGEGGKIGAKATPQFERVNYEIEKYAGYFPVTNEVLDDNDANLAQVLIEWIGDESRVTANKLILAAIATKDQVDLKDMDGIKKAVNVTLGQAFKSTAKIVTNDDGLQYLDTLKDETGRYLLTPVPGETMAMSLQVGAQRIPVEVIPNADMPSSGTKVPFVVGDLKEGIVYWDRKMMNIKLSDVAVVGDLNAYEEDLTLYRAIEREDVTTRDTNAFVNGYIDTAVVGE